jgi:uncharacterized protein YjbI with pentapeptide repeats
MKESIFVDCQIKNADFYNAELNGSKFKGSDLESTLFENTNLTGTDFREAKNFSIHPLMNKIKDAQFSMPEAIALLRALGIKVEY